MKGKAIYNPKGKAGEYSYWAVNFYNGCSADCEYCYCKKGPMSSLWSNVPTLKKTLVSPEKAIEIFKKEVMNNLESLREHGLFFNFSSDPFLRETIELNYEAMQFCRAIGIQIIVLTKQTWWIREYTLPKNTAIGFTLTGFDRKEPGAASTEDRIRALDYFAGWYPLWVSLEPVINPFTSLDIIRRTSESVNHYKIGPLSGKKFSKEVVEDFIFEANKVINGTVYWKEGFVENMGIDRSKLADNCVDRNYKWYGEQ